jgi:hypothetical protein
MGLNGSITFPIIMIIGAPRSGTSLLGRVLNQHPLISTWVEPYYIWDHHFRKMPDDEMTAEQATDEVRFWIRDAFIKYKKKLKADWIVDKSPRNCLKIPFVQKIFPEAYYIFLLRDGRDTIFSIWSQWTKKGGIFTKNRGNSQWQNRLYVIRRWLRRRPTWKLRVQSILFELGPPANWMKKKFLNNLRWDGKFGWGPRFKGWRKLIDRVTPLEFSAYQWDKCARGILNNIPLISEQKRYVLKYEDFIQDPQTTIGNLFSFLQIELPDKFMDGLPPIWADNSNKWQQLFSTTDLKRIGPIIGKTITQLGYESDESWYLNPGS